MTTTHGIIHCPGCGREFAWHARFAGRQARCACGRVIQYPSQPEPAESPASDAEDDSYDLAPTTRPKPARVEPLPALPVQALPVQVLGYKSAKRLAGEKPELDVERLTKQTLPLWLLTGGLLIEGGLTFLRARFWWGSPTTAVLHFLVDIAFGTVVMTAGVLLAARLRQIPIGSLPSALLRLAAVIVASDAACDMLAPAAFVIPLGGIVLMLMNFALYFALLGALFELDESDTWFCLGVILVLHLSLFFCFRVLLA